MAGFDIRMNVSKQPESTSSTFNNPSSAQDVTTENISRFIAAATPLLPRYSLAAQQTQQITGEAIKRLQQQTDTVTVGSNSRLEDTHIMSQGKDALRIQGDDANLKNIHITDTGHYASKGGHVDAGQLIPPDQFIGGVLHNLNVDGFHVKGSPKVDSIQGLFSSDGCLVNINLKNGVLDMGSPNKIAFNGLASGHLDGFVDGEGETLPARLHPLRIGGNPGTGNVWVLSVSPKEHECNPKEITGSNYFPELDKRRVLPNPQATQDIGLCDFRLDEFKRDVKDKTVTELLANPDNQTKVNHWLEWVRTTKQPEFKGQYESISKAIRTAKESNQTIGEITGGRLQPIFYQLIAQTYGTRCTQAQE